MAVLQFYYSSTSLTTSAAFYITVLQFYYSKDVTQTVLVLHSLLQSTAACLMAACSALVSAALVSPVSVAASAASAASSSDA